MVCEYCNKNPAAERHHIIHGTKVNKKLSEKYDRACMINLCRECHSKVHHVGGELDLILKKQAHRKFKEEYPEEDWFKIFGKNYDY